MGTWSTSITGNDTAQDLLFEYKAAFFYYDVDTAVKKIDEFVRTMFNETDEVEFCAYFYSLAEFMWKKGILTDEIRDRAVKMVDSDFGMDDWIEAGSSIEKARRKVLKQFKEKITSPQCAPKKIKIDFHMKDIFNDGEYIAIQLKTADKPYACRSDFEKGITDDEFHHFNNKYVVLQKIKSYISCGSVIVPEVCDRWAVFRLFKGLYESPSEIDISCLEEVDWILDNPLHYHDSSPFFTTESSMLYFKKRGFQVIGNGRVPDVKTENNVFPGISFGFNKPNYNADSEIVRRLYPFELEIGRYEGKTDVIYEIIELEVHNEIGYGNGLYGEEYQKYLERFNKMFTRKRNEFDEMVENGAAIYEIHKDFIYGIAVKMPDEKPRLYMRTQNAEYAEKLKRYVDSLG